MLGIKQSNKFKPHHLILALHKIGIVASFMTTALISMIVSFFPEYILSSFIAVFFLILFMLPTALYFSELNRLNHARFALKKSKSPT